VEAGSESHQTGADGGAAQDAALDVLDSGLDDGSVEDSGKPTLDGGDLGLDDAGPNAGAQDGDGGGSDGGSGDGGCFLSDVGVYGQCISTTACAALANYVSTPGYCPGPADIQCCTLAPSVANNPPVPAGWQLMQQSAVTPAMTAWAVSILNDPTMYPMFSTTIQTFCTLMVMARVEWHPPDFQNNTVHRGVTLYVPIG
jgi:hypothetical protein